MRLCFGCMPIEMKIVAGYYAVTLVSMAGFLGRFILSWLRIRVFACSTWAFSCHGGMKHWLRKMSIFKVGMPIYGFLFP